MIPSNCYIRQATPAASIPPEIWRSIIDLVPETHGYCHNEITCKVDDEDYSNYRKEATTTMLAISHVCRNLKAISREAKWAWSTLLDIDTNSSQWFKELMQRSNPWPLIILSNSDKNSVYNRFYSVKWTRLLKDFHRVRVLRVSVNQHDSDISPLIDALSVPSPLLESCNISLKYDDSLDIGFHKLTPWTSKSLKGTLFAGVAPRLIKLVLNDVLEYSLTDLSLFRLIHLDIYNASLAVSPNAFTVQQWLDFLAGQPLLESLQLPGNLFRDADTATQPGPRRRGTVRVNLPALSYLKLTDLNTLHVVELLENLLFDYASCDVHLELIQRSYWRAESISEFIVHWAQRVFHCWKPTSSPDHNFGHYSAEISELDDDELDEDGEDDIDSDANMDGLSAIEGETLFNVEIHDNHTRAKSKPKFYFEYCIQASDGERRYSIAQHIQEKFENILRRICYSGNENAIEFCHCDPSRHSIRFGR